MFGWFQKSAKEFTANVNEETSPITVHKGETLLAAALREGLAWPHKCKVGSCGRCRAVVESGRIKPQIDFSYIFSPEELQAGCVLACQSELKSDIEVKVKLQKEKK